jgi:hypothetical protein
MNTAVIAGYQAATIAAKNLRIEREYSMITYVKCYLFNFCTYPDDDLAISRNMWLIS